MHSQTYTCVAADGKKIELTRIDFLFKKNYSVLLDNTNTLVKPCFLHLYLKILNINCVEEIVFKCLSIKILLTTIEY